MTIPAVAGRAARTRAKWMFVGTLALLSLLDGRLQPDAMAQRADPLDWRASPNALELELSASPARGSATFLWQLLAEGQGVTCELDADGDGAFDHELSDCDARKELRHSYARSGVYFATLVARSTDGRAGIARTRVIVAAD